MRMWRRGSLVILLAAGLGLQPGAVAQVPSPVPTLQPFRPDSPPVRRALPVERRPEPPLARAVPKDLPPTPVPGVPPPPPEPAATAPEPDGGAEIRIAPGAAGAADLSPEDAQYNLATQFYVRKEYEQAAPQYERYLGQYPAGAKRQAALWWLGECYRTLGRPAAARSSYQNLIVAHLEGEFVGPANYRLATMDFADKDYRTAVGRFQRAASLAKADDVRLSSRYFEALCLENLNRRDETREVYEDILAIVANNPYRDEAHLALARLAIAQKHPNDAFKQYEALSREASKPALQAESALKAGLLARELDQNDAAEALLTRAADAPGASAAVRTDALLARLHLLYETNKYQPALELYNASAAALPGASQAEATLIAASSQRQLGKHAEAQLLYARIVAEFPASPQAPEARYQRIISLYASNAPEFVREADNYLLSNPAADKADQVRLMKADMLFKRADYAGAAVAYAGLEGAGNLPAKYKAEAAYRLGYCYSQTKQPDKTIAAFTKFLRGYRDHPFASKALVQRAVAFQQLKNYPSALADYTEVIEEHRGAKEREIALQQKALIQGQQEDGRGMADTFRKLLKDYPKTDAAGQANFYIGRAAFDAKDYAGALVSFEAARRADPKEYGARASLLIVLGDFQLKDKAKLGPEADDYLKSGAQPAIPSEVLFWLGSQEVEDKEYARAERHLAAAAESKTNKTPETWLALARTQLLLEKWDPALASSRRYLEAADREPASRAVGLLAQGDAQLGAAKFDDAQKSADEAMQLQPEGLLNARARLLGGRIAFARGDFEAAGKSFMSVAVLYDDADITPQALRQAAAAFGKAGKPAEAAKAIEELKSRFPNFTATAP